MLKVKFKLESSDSKSLETNSDCGLLKKHKKSKATDLDIMNLKMTDPEPMQIFQVDKAKKLLPDIK